MIKVGLIRCDTHAAWFGALMAPHEPLTLRQPVAFRPDLPYTWMAGGVHYFHYSLYKDPTRMTCPFVGGFEITRVWDPHPEAAEAFAGLFLSRPKVCASFEEVSEGVDLVFLAECNGDGSDHEELSAPGLRRGVPTFIDKPLASTLAGAQRISEMAKKFNAPLFSASILQFDQEVLWFRNRLPETGRVDSGIVSGVNTHPAGLVHSVSAAMTIFGDGVKEARCLDVPSGPVIHLDYGQRDDRPSSGILIRCAEASYRWTTMKASAYGPNGDIHGQLLHDFNCQHGSAEIVRRIKTMVETGRAPEEQPATLKIIAVMDAILQAQRSGGVVRVENLGESYD